jgi:hypothetical protein
MQLHQRLQHNLHQNKGKFMKHVGKMKNNSARVAVIFRTLPGDANSCLVVGTQGLGDSHHDNLMSLIERPEGQQANELADILATRRFADGSVMLDYLHAYGHLKKVPTKLVLMTPDSQTQIPLDELNKIIAEQKGVSVSELAVNDGSQQPKKNTKKVEVSVDEIANVTTHSSDATEQTQVFDLSPAEMRSRADALYKEAARLRKEADDLDPPKSKKKVAKVEVE